LDFRRLADRNSANAPLPALLKIGTFVMDQFAPTMLRYLPIALILLLGSCVSNETADSNDVNQAEIYPTYRFNWSNGSYKASVSYRFGGENGTTLRLTEPSQVTYNGMKLTEGKFLFGGAYYSIEGKKYNTSHSFVFTDSDGKKYENTYTFDRIEFANAPKSVSKSKDLEIQLTRPVSRTENLVFTANCDTLAFHEMVVGSSPKDSVYYDSGKRALIVRAGYFRDFPTKSAQIWLSKTDMITPLEQRGSLDGEFHFDYQSGVISVKVKD
jgi:hypothetical protein